MISVTARALQGFVTDGYGRTAWQDVTRAARCAEDNFELLLPYEKKQTLSIIDAAAERLDRSRAEILEDLGLYLVSHPNNETVRRMLRYSGSSFEEFIEALPDLPDRARLVLPHVAMPPLHVAWHDGGLYLVDCRADDDVTRYIMLGVIRAMADDFGALAVLGLTEDGAPQGWHRISIEVPLHSFGRGRSFALADGAKV